MAGPIAQYVLQQSSTLPHGVLDQQKSMFSDLLKHKQQALTRSIHHQCPSDLQYITGCLQEKGASAWLTSLPIEQHGFVLHKGTFTDALCLHYGWTSPRLPSHCVCGSDFSTSHAFSCPHGAFPSIRHNNICDFTASLLSEVCHNVKVGHYLQPLTGETLRYKTAVSGDNARLGILAAGFCGNRFQYAFFDVRVFNSLAPSYTSSTLTAAYHRHEQEKRCAYEERVREVEHGCFTPVVFSTSGGMRKAATIVYKHLAHLLSIHCNSSYPSVMCWLRCTLSFSLLKSCVFFTYKIHRWHFEI